MDARHGHAALSARLTKSDRNDARGLAEMVRMSWYKEVQVRSLTAHERMALLGVRRRLVCPFAARRRSSAAASTINFATRSAPSSVVKRPGETLKA
jgi:transposase